MKKIVSILALCAVVLGSASCSKKGNDDVKLKRFNIGVENITATTADITITPPNEQMYYINLLLNEATYNFFNREKNGVKEAMNIFAASQGSYSDTWTGLCPNTKYVLCIGEVDKSSSTKKMVGQVEYVRFQTQIMPAQVNEDLEPLAMNGEFFWLMQTADILQIGAQCPVPGAEDKLMKIYLFFVSDKRTGHFTSDKLFAYIFAQSNMEVLDETGKQELSYIICGADIQGSYSAGTYQYSGTVDVYNANDGLLRLPVSIECPKYTDK